LEFFIETLKVNLNKEIITQVGFCILINIIVTPGDQNVLKWEDDDSSYYESSDNASEDGNFGIKDTRQLL